VRFPAAARCRGLVTSGAIHPITGRPWRPDDWFPERGENNMIAAAVAACAKCTVRQECLDDERGLPRHSGVRGGLSAAARKRGRSRSGEEIVP